MSSDSPGKRIVDATEEIHRSPEWQIRSRLEELAFSFRLHARNYSELKRWTHEVVAEDDESAGKLLRMWRQGNEPEIQKVLEEAGRLLHNFLTSAKTLVDHTRNHIKDLYAGTAFEAEYDAEVDAQVATKPVCRFVQQLRNYNLHYRLPFVTGSLNIKFDPPGQVETMTSRMALDAGALRKWGRWDRDAKQYLADAGNELPIDKLADDYMSAIQQFYEWQHHRALEIHKEPLTRLQQRINRVKRLEREAFPPRSDTQPSGGSEGSP